MKNVVIGISGGIAVYKVCSLVRLFKTAGTNVDVIMTKNATEFVAPLTFETLSNRPVISDMFCRTQEWEVEHISLAKKADIFVVCPATANVIGKMANGIADDMLTTTAMAAKCPIVVCPAMNTNMYQNVAFQKNLNTLIERGVHVVNSCDGFLACSDSGKGRMAEPQQIFDYAMGVLQCKQDLKGKNVLISCGATLEKLDDVRFISNFSSGKMGFALANQCIERGANVTIVLGRHSAKIPDGTKKIVEVLTTQDMYDAVLGEFEQNDIFILAAAPCDFRPKQFSQNKIKSDSLVVEFQKNPDIAKAIGQKKGKKLLVIFSAETNDEVENAKIKLKAKNADFVVSNNIKQNEVFASDTNVVSIIDQNAVEAFEKMSKDQVAQKIVDKVVRLL